jgi:phosphoribosylglycinamide formyltransferase 1
MRRLGVLLSGRGSNFEAIARNIREGKLDAEIATVISNRENAVGLETARALGLRSVCIPSRGADRVDYDRLLLNELRAAEVDLVVLAGFMRMLSSEFVTAFPERILNIHPSLLPAFPGLDAQHQAWSYGVRYSGCTVHFVDAQMDSGPIVQQAVVEVDDQDTAETLAAKILVEEHRIYSEAIALVLRGGFSIEGRRVMRRS